MMSKLPHRAHEILVAAGGAVVLPQWPVELDPDPELAGCLVVTGEPDGAEPVVTVHLDPVPDPRNRGHLGLGVRGRVLQILWVDGGVDGCGRGLTAVTGGHMALGLKAIDDVPTCTCIHVRTGGCPWVRML